MNLGSVALFLVSIPGSESRRDRVLSQLSALGARPPISVVGLMGRYLPDQVCIKLTRDPNSVNNKGALGCFLSHVDVWERFLHGTQEYAVVVEDDVTINSLIPASEVFLDGIDFDVLFVNDRTSKSRVSVEAEDFATFALFENIRDISLRREAIGTDGYAITKAGAKALLSRIAVDSYFSHIDLRMAAYCLEDSEVSSINELELGRELAQIRKVCLPGPKLRARILANPMVTHDARNSTRIQEDKLGRREAIEPT